VADTRTCRVWVQTVGKVVPLECPKPDTFNRQFRVVLSPIESAFGIGKSGHLQSLRTIGPPKLWCAAFGDMLRTNAPR
jgi:hypothetical protein